MVRTRVRYCESGLSECLVDAADVPVVLAGGSRPGAGHSHDGGCTMVPARAMVPVRPVVRPAPGLAGRIRASGSSFGAIDP